MKKLIITLLICISTVGVVVAQGGIAISNFNAKSISSSELLISVNYSFSRKVNTEYMVIQAFPVMSDGKANYRDVLYESHPLEVGDHQVNFKITKKPEGKNFRSEGIKVCIINRRSVLLCEEFPLDKLWIDSKSSVKIISFTASHNKVEKGDAVTLSWKTENASKLKLGRFGTSDFHEVSSSGSETIIIDKSSTFVLIASPKSSNGPTKVESSKVKITVTNNNPVIGTLYASRSTIRRGIESKLFWKVYGADQVTLNDEPVQSIGDKVVAPTRTTKYVLRAQAGDIVVEKSQSIYVTPFVAPELSDPIYSLELCKSIEKTNGYSKCISSDGPFVTGDKIFLMARFKSLPKGKYNVKRITYRGFFGKDKWAKAHQEESAFVNTGNGEGLITFPITNLGEGAKKLKIIFNNDKKTASEIIYCIDCSRMWD